MQVIQLVLWIVDSGFSKNMTSNLQLLRNFDKKLMGTVRFENDHFTAITGYGDYIQGNLTIRHVYYIEGLEDDDLLIGSHDSNLYTISIYEMAASSPVCLMSRATSIKSWLWHHRLYHFNFGTINQLTSQDLVDGLPKFKYNKDHLCSACEQEFDGNVFYNPPETPMFKEAESSSTFHDPSNMHEFHQKHHSSDRWTKNHLIEQVIDDPSRPGVMLIEEAHLEAFNFWEISYSVGRLKRKSVQPCQLRKLIFHMAQQVITAAQLVLRYHTIGRRNNYMVLQSIPCSTECKIVGQILLDHLLSYALTATADVPTVYLQQFWRRVSKVPVETLENLFVAPVNIETIEAFMNRVAYQVSLIKIDEDYHSIKDDTPLVSMYTIGNVLVRGMLIPDAFLTKESRATLRSMRRCLCL
ncbi:retrovirus-related pol polyprotein from transposon TNT 1-94 [Tanacetum coccineum]